MPVILLSVDANTSSASAGIAAVVANLNSMVGAVDRTTVATNGLDAALARATATLDRQLVLWARTEVALNAATDATARYGAAMDALNGPAMASLATFDAQLGRLGAMATVSDATTQSIRMQTAAWVDLAAAQRFASGSSLLGVPSQSVARESQLAVRTGLAGVTGSGGFNLGAGGVGATGGSGVLGAATIPVVVAAVGAYLGIKAVGVANQYNQSVTDIVGTSSQNAALIPAFQQGILALAGGQNRFTPQQLVTAAYPVASDPTFGNSPSAFLGAMKVISQQAQPAGAAALPGLASADVGAYEAFHLRGQKQFQAVADSIAKGVNVGLAEPADFAKGIGTFGASAGAAGLAGTTGLAQAAGAFAQGSVLSPRFRFDAQGLNALFQQVTGKQSAGAATAESNLGIRDLFGVGAIGNAGGLPQWLQQLQAATAGSHQQDFLQAIFTRQNALQTARGLTGVNFGTAQSRIGQVEQYGGTAALGASLSDQGPQAQWDQIQSQFNKDVIQVGNTISTTLNPDLLLLGTGALDAAGKLGDFVGAIGDGIDRLSTMLNLPSKVRTAVNDAGAAKDAAGAVVSSLLRFGSGGGAPKLPGVGMGYELGASDRPFSRPLHLGAVPLGFTANSTLNLPGQGGLVIPVGEGISTSEAAKRYPHLSSVSPYAGPQAPAMDAALTTLASVTHAASGALELLGGTLGRTTGVLQASLAGSGSLGLSAAQIAANQAAALSAIHSQTHHTSAFTANASVRDDRSAINSLLTGGGSPAQLAAQLAALKEALPHSRYTAAQQHGIYGTEAFKVRSATLGPGDQLAVQAAQQNLDAAVQMGDMPDKLKQYQDTFLADQRRLYQDTEHGTTLAKSLRSVAQQGAVYNYQDQTVTLNRGIKDLQNAVSIDKLTGNSTAQVQAEQHLLSYQTQHAGVLKLDPSDLALLAAQYRQDLIATYPVKNVDPFFQTNQRLGNFEAGAGSTLVRGGGSMDPTTTEVRRLQQELNAANKEIVSLLTTIARNSGIRAQAASKSGAVSGRYGTAP